MLPTAVYLAAEEVHASGVVAVLVATLLLPGFTLPTLVRVLGVAEDADASTPRNRWWRSARGGRRWSGWPRRSARRTCRRRCRPRCTSGWRGSVHCCAARPRRTTTASTRCAGGRGVVQQVQSAALAAARAEVLAARREAGIDPEAADRVLHRLDLRTVLLG